MVWCGVRDGSGMAGEMAECGVVWCEMVVVWRERWLCVVWYGVVGKMAVV